MTSGTDIFIQSQLQEALADYHYLINKGYPEKGALKMVGDRYRLSGSFRTILYRGVASHARVNRLLKRITNNIDGHELAIDGYNVVFTLMNYKLGRHVFISLDGICRDAGSLFGKVRNQDLFKETLEQTIQYLSIRKLLFVQFFFDAPVSFSREHANYTENLLHDFSIPGCVKVVKNADLELVNANSQIVCTSDSEILENTKQPICDLPYQLITYYYAPRLLDLTSLLE